jgi:hypothetical protein
MISLRTRFSRNAVASIAIVAASWPQIVFAQTLGQGTDDAISLWRVAGALLLCAGFAVAGAFVLKARMGGGASTSMYLPFAAKRERRIKLVETLRLGPKAGLSIVACDDRELLVLVSESGSQIVREISSAPASSSTAMATRKP